MLSIGLGLSDSSAELIQINLGNKMTPDLEKSISDLTSGNLVQGFESDRDGRSEQGFVGEKTVAELEEFLKHGHRSGKPNSGLWRKLIYHYCTANDAEKAQKHPNV